MLLRKVAVENARSFLERTEVALDGQISIIIGPNGGGKTNLLDIIVQIIRKHLLISRLVQPAPDRDRPTFQRIELNPSISNSYIEKHHLGKDRPQIIEISVEVTEQDVRNMRTMKQDAEELATLAEQYFSGVPIRHATDWQPEWIPAPGSRFTFKVVDSNLVGPDNKMAMAFLQYLQIFEIESRLRQEFQRTPLSTPLMYLPVNRSTSGFNASVTLSEYEEHGAKQQADSVTSRSGGSPILLAIGKLAKRYRLLQEDDNQNAKSIFYSDPALIKLSTTLEKLGYEWSLGSTNPEKNTYTILLNKEGTAFDIAAASSGERELLIYLFAIFVLNVRDALIIVDEPELHLHPRWQKILLKLFIDLSQDTGNQFLLATHSPTFVSPESIQYVSRVYSAEQRSRIKRINQADLPQSKHVMALVNSQNNEKAFFADVVVLVEGISDRLLFESVLRLRQPDLKKTIEIIEVGGKGVFPSYEKILSSADIPFKVIADLDYLREIGSEKVKQLLTTSTSKIKKDVVDNTKSLDGQKLCDDIDLAMQTGSWDHAIQTWEYIKSKRTSFKFELDQGAHAVIDSFCNEQLANGICVLRRGTLESYLPSGYAAKDVEKLVAFLADSSFWNELPPAIQQDLDRIAEWIVNT